jgi:hypothetical protein
VVTGVTGDRSYVISVVAYAALVTVLCLEIRRRVLVRQTAASRGSGKCVPGSEENVY